MGIHSGRIKRGVVLFRGHDGMTVPEAKTYCLHHPNCVAFTYPVHSMNITSPDNITFVSSINSFSDNGLGEWRTYISNDLNKAKYINETSIEYNDLPYPVCCNEKEAPSIKDIEAVDTFERISCNISREEFYEQYEKTRTPVMLVGCDEHWAAKERWTIDKLIPRFTNTSKWRCELHDQDATDYDHDTVPWNEIIDRAMTNRDFYIFGNEFLAREENRQLLDDFECPGPFQGADIYGHLKDFHPPGGKYLWFMVAPRGTGSFPHVDPQATDAWNSLVKGHKWWIIYPGDADYQGSAELECDDYCSSDTEEYNWYTSVGINALRNECSNGKFPQHILQKPGETIYVPYGRYHAEFNMDETIGVTANFASPANLWSVWHEIVMDGEEHWKRAYYQVFDKEQRKQLRDWKLWPVEDMNLKEYKNDINHPAADEMDDDDDDSDDKENDNEDIEEANDGENSNEEEDDDDDDENNNEEDEEDDDENNNEEDDEE